MHIANPIYDVVFKFLMEDPDSAILLLSTIINEQIETLDFLPQEQTLHLTARSMTVYRLDFCAKIKTEQGHKQVLIEIQKAKLPSDIMRFRRYLGEQYSKKSNVYTVYNENRKKDINKPLPIISIYFLGYALANIDTPVLKINRHYYDVVNDQQLDVKAEFVESLTHDSYVIQISKLRTQHQTELEDLLDIFDQTHHLLNDEHILDIDEQHYPEKYRALVRRLQGATLEPEVRETMLMEDELIEDLQDMERVIAEKEQAIVEKEQVIIEKEQAIVEKEQTIVEKEQTIVQKEQAIVEKEQTIVEKEQAIAEKEQTIIEKDQNLNQALHELEEKDKLIAQLKKQLS